MEASDDCCLQVKLRVRRHGNRNRTSLRNYLALMEGMKEHTLGVTLSDTEKDWLAQVINEVLENIKQGAGEV